MLRKFDLKDFDKIYEIMELSFPRDEYRQYEGQKALLDDEAYQIYVLSDEQTLEIKGLIAIWEYESLVFVEHLAVAPQYRNGGIGSLILKETEELLGKMLCLEVELPETELASRRIDFYKRNGYYLNKYPYMQPALAEGQEPVPLLIMTTHKELTAEEFENIKELLYTKVYKII
jgi:ribosomal protein S18 acetylase RimI-like enzyme